MRCKTITTLSIAGFVVITSFARADVPVTLTVSGNGGQVYEPQAKHSGATDFTLASPTIYWHSAAVCNALEGTLAGNEINPVHISRIAVFGSAVRDLLYKNAPRPFGICNQYRVRSNIAVDTDFLYFVDAAGSLLRVSRNASVIKLSNGTIQGDEPQLVSNFGGAGFLAGASGQAEIRNVDAEIYLIPPSRAGVIAVNKTSGQAVIRALFSGPYRSLQYDGQYVYWLEASGDLIRMHPGNQNRITIAGSANAYFAEGTRFVRVPPFGFEFIDRVYFAQGATVNHYDNINGTTSGPRYQSDVAGATILELTLSGNNLFVLEERPQDQTFVRLKVLLRKRLNVAGLMGEGLYGVESTLDSLATDGTFLLFRQTDNFVTGTLRSIMRLANEAAAISQTDMRITGLELTQGIQDVANNVLLIQDRRTFARVYVKSDGPNVAGVTATLSGSVGGVSLGTLNPSNDKGTRITVLSTPTRNDLNQGFLFELPWAWTRSTDLTLQAALNPNRWPPQASYAGNIFNAGVFKFFASPRPTIFSVRMAYRLPGLFSADAGYAEATFAERANSESKMRRLYPLASIGDNGLRTQERDLFLFDEGLGARVAQSADECLRMKAEDREYCANNYVSARLNALVQTGPFAAATGVHGLIPQNSFGQFTRGACCDGHAAAGPSNDETYASHEMGHLFGRAHPATSAICGHSQDDQNYPPYLGAFIGPALSDPQTGLAGFDPGDPGSSLSTKQWLPAANAFDFMSYCLPPWVSDYTYKGLFGTLSLVAPGNPPAGGRRAGSIAAAPAVSDWLLVAGDISPSLGTANILNTQRASQALEPSVDAAGRYSLQLLNNSAAVVAQHPFVPAQVEGSTSLLSYRLAIPFVDGTRTLRIIDSVTAQTLVSKPVSSNAPTVSAVSLGTVVQPLAGTITMSWQANDLDNDKLTYDVFLSRNNGADLQPLILGLRDKRATIDTKLFGGGNVRFRVLASDGVQTGFAESIAVALTSKPPAVRVALPSTGTRIEWGQLVNLAGEAIDPQEGSLTGAALQWSIPRGSLGSGRALSVSDLPVGVNEITLTATNRFGLSATSTVTVTVGDDLALPGPMLTVGPGDLGWHVASNANTPQQATLSIGNSGSGVLKYTAVSNAPWLTLSGAQGTAPAALNLTGNPVGLPNNVTSETIVTVSADGLPSQSFQIKVTLTKGATVHCPSAGDPSQPDSDRDGIIDICDPDRDGDGVPNFADNCPRVVNPDQTDSDSDGWGNVCDNCTTFANSDQRDTDRDGYGNVCDGDLNNNRVVNSIDLALFKQRFLGTDPEADLNGDGNVNSLDLARFKQLFLKPPGPSAKDL